MKKFACVALALVLIGGGLGCKTATQTAKDAVILVDEKAQENEAVVEKLCLDPDSVTEDERVEAIRTARLISTLTAKLRNVLGLSEGGN